MPLVIAILAANENVVRSNLDLCLMMGELSLDGSLKPVRGVLPGALKARDEGFKSIIVPIQNASEAAVVQDLKVYGLGNLKDVVDHFIGMRDLQVYCKYL